MTPNLEAARAAAEKAAAIMRHFQNDISQLTVTLKGRFDLLTQADVACEEVIIETLKAHFPNDRFMGEESGGATDLNGRVWIIDPIDGTTNFSHGFPFFCCSIALWEDGKPLAGLVYAPMTNERFEAERGKGAFLNGKRIQVSSFQKPEEVVLGTGFPYRDVGLIDDYLRLMRVFMEETQGLRRPGSAAYDLCCVAAGRYGGFFEYALAPWDVAAAAVIVLEAGGVITDWTGGQNWLKGRRITCGNTAIHAYILQRINENISENLRKM